MLPEPLSPSLSSPRRPAGLAPSRTLRAKLLREVHALGLPTGPTGPERVDPVTEADLASLPETAQRYLRFMAVLGRPRTWSVRARSGGLFRLGPKQAWMPCEVWQYDTCLDVARIFLMRLRLRGVLPMLVRDTYVRGEGRMRGRVLDAVSVVDQSDEKIAIGELVTFVNDAVMWAPSMLLTDAVRWTAVDDRSFDVALTDRGRTVSARVFVKSDGELVDFSTTDRFGPDPAQPGEMVRARWSTPVNGFRTFGGRPVAASGAAIWHFASGDLKYADFTVEDLDFDVSP